MPRCSPRPAHVDEWLRSQVVAEPLRHIVSTRARHVEELAADLGGVDRVSAQERRVLEIWFMAMVAADVEHQRLLASAVPEIGERFMTALNTARSALTALGLERRAADVTPRLDEYLRTRGNGAGPANSSESDADPAPAADRSAGEESEGA